MKKKTNRKNFCSHERERGCDRGEEEMQDANFTNGRESSFHSKLTEEANPLSHFLFILLSFNLVGFPRVSFSLLLLFKTPKEKQEKKM